MNKNNIIFSCSNCNAQFQKWIGRCLECGKWGTIEKAQANTQKNLNIENEYDAIKTTTLDEIQGKNFKRLKTGVEELDRVLGGGLVPGSLILLGGEPGVGKSTLALQLAALLPNALYLSGEESIEQIKLRAERLALKSPTLQLANTTNIENIIATIQKNPSLAIIDSVQTVSSSEAEGEAGNITQIRACTTKLMALAKTTGAVIVLIGQVTKDGAVAGPKTLEHLVDVVLYLEGDKYHQYRILRAAKNRFGSTDEIGVFNMMEHGLVEVKNPSAAFLSGREDTVPGSVVTCLVEGSRPVLVEIQALVTKTNFGYPQRRASGFDLNRLQVLIGVLGKRAGLPLDSYDVFLNVVGGIVAEEPAADLAVILALASALQNKTLPKNIAAFGEVGLGGEVRAVGQIRKRLEEIKKMGFEFAVTPSLKETDKITGLKIAPIKNVKEVVEKIIK
ncbi:MAG: repair protein radA protein [Candidatus Magasanikbacteria bacterium GW2011_GWA2_37_8]|uniref:DNA repair protein RadA n=1 Tax=Candidatus Magasanikbacteria bacterium GW2011_GWA2_37_8 TaxID=1619036 RepID=A0A0G0HC72_9BACT|nr:MAG: repair protein radA protein [Candidatus Magasanikbacteria bacterium GW2011_GWA2_37_8]